MKIIDWLKLPEGENKHDLSDPATSLLHAKIIQRKPFLKRLYADFYGQFKRSLQGNIEGKLFVELGSGGGFIKDIIPGVITSDVVALPGVDRHFSASSMPFENNTVDAYFLLGVLHHVREAEAFFREVERSLKTGGKLVMIEPANTLWGRFIYKNFHHEAFEPSSGWGLEETGPLSSANSAMPWIIFYRDRAEFERKFPGLRILKVKPHTPFRYLASGGLTLRQLLPSFSYNIVKGIEMILSPANRYLGMFLTIEIEKVN